MTATIRPATPADAAALGAAHVQAWRETYPGIVPDTVLAALDPAEKAAMWRASITAGGIVLVALLDGAVIGFAAGGAQREPALMPYPGEIYSLYVLRAGQRRSLGRTLMAALARALASRGFASANLWVLAGNDTALAFYRALGGREVHRRQFQDGDWHGADIALAWDDLAPLTAAPDGHAQTAQAPPPAPAL